MSGCTGRVSGVVSMLCHRRVPINSHFQIFGTLWFRPGGLTLEVTGASL